MTEHDIFIAAEEGLGIQHQDLESRLGHPINPTTEWTPTEDGDRGVVEFSTIKRKNRALIRAGLGQFVPVPSTLGKLGVLRKGN